MANAKVTLSLVNLPQTLAGLSNVARASQAVGGGVSGAARGFTGGFVGGLVGGPVGSLLGALATGSINGIATAVGGIIAQSTRMAYEFERASTRAAQQLSLGTGSNLRANVRELQAAAYRGAAFNIAAPEMMRALAAYGGASGQTAIQTARAGATIGLYARAYGLDPTQTGAMLGGVTAMSGRDVRTEAAGIFGAAETAGNLGRRLPEFIATTTSVLSQLQAANARQNYSGADAAALVSNISRAGGYFNTSAAVTATVGALQGLVQGEGSGLRRLALAQAAGITNPEDLILERNGPQQQRAYLSMLSQRFGDSQSPFFAAQLRELVGPDQARTLVDLMGKFRRKGYSDEGAIAQIFKPGGTNVRTEEQKAQARVAQYKSTELADYEKLFTTIENDQLKVGKTVLNELQTVAASLNDALNGNWKAAVNDLTTSNKLLLAGVLALAAVNALSSGGNVLGLFRGMMGAGAAGGAGGAGGLGAALRLLGLGGVAGLAVGGFMLATTASAGDADESKRMENYNSKAIPQSLLKTFGRSPRSAALWALAGNESAFGTYPGLYTSTSGAIGTYQVEPDTANEQLAKLGIHGIDANTAAGRTAILRDPELQAKISGKYLEHLEHVSMQREGRINWRHIAGAYYAGEGHWGEDSWIAGQDVPGNTNTMTEKQYEDEFSGNLAKITSTSVSGPGAKEFNAHIYLSPKKGARPLTGTRINNRPAHMRQ